MVRGNQEQRTGVQGSKGTGRVAGECPRGSGKWTRDTRHQTMWSSGGPGQDQRLKDRIGRSQRDGWRTRVGPEVGREYRAVPGGQNRRQGVTGVPGSCGKRVGEAQRLR